MTQTTIIDKAKAVRPGEELDLEALVPWLTEHCALPNVMPQVTQYAGGASNWTYCLRYELDGQNDYRDVILRRAPKGTKAKGAHDMGREYRLQRALKPTYPLVPEMLGLCSDESIIGAEFYVMQKLNGVIMRNHPPKGLHLDKPTVSQLCRNAIDGLIELHQVDVEAAGLSGLAKGAGYVERQISGWNGRYQKAHTWNVPKAHNIMRWLEDNMPSQETICLTHNDYRFDNLVLSPDDPTTIIGVLDWELATLGDPLMDLGNSLAYWVQADDDKFALSTRRQPTHLAGMMTREQVIEYYAQKTGADVANMGFYQVYGLFRLAVIVQQIYFRYHHKQTQNKAFKHLWLFNHYLQHRCRKIIKAS